MKAMKFRHLFDPDDESGKDLLAWWRGLEEDRGGRAELRRAQNPAEVAFSPLYHRLYKKLRLSNREGLACVAGLCAHVKENMEALSVAKQMAQGEKPKVSGLRFRRLLAINSREELYCAMIRVLRLLGSGVNVCDLAKTVYWWNEKTKRDLAYQYYADANAE